MTREKKELLKQLKELNRKHYVNKGFRDIDTFVKSVLSYNN